MLRPGGDLANGHVCMLSVGRGVQRLTAVNSEQNVLQAVSHAVRLNTNHFIAFCLLLRKCLVQGIIRS